MKQELAPVPEQKVSRRSSLTGPLRPPGPQPFPISPRFSPLTKTVTGVKGQYGLPRFLSTYGTVECSFLDSRSMERHLLSSGNLPWSIDTTVQDHESHTPLVGYVLTAVRVSP